MSKLISTAAVVGVVMLTVTQDASAGRRRRCQQSETVWYTPAPVVTTAPAASAPAVTPAPAVAQSANGSTYRSYSYNPAPAYQAPAPNVYRQPAQEPSQANFFRADRKAHGLSWYRNQ